MVGAGFSGAVLARELAERLGCRVTVVESRSHVAGNCHTERDPATGVMVHVYGPHIFHTNSREVFEYQGGIREFVELLNKTKEPVHDHVVHLFAEAPRIVHALNLTLPESSSAVKSGASENPPLLVSMDKTGALLFGLDKVPLTLADLQGQLTAGADKARLEKREPKMVIMADQATPWAKIVSVMDAGAKAKIKSISAVTKANNKS